jgi:Tfp pilus assembly protein FimT
MSETRNTSKQYDRRGGRTRGFSVLELLVGAAITMILAGILIPNFNTAMHTSRLRGAATDFASLIQVERIRAVDDDRYYSAYILGNNPQEGFVDIYPQNANGASGGGGNVVDPKDPVIQINSEISQQPVNSAPKTANLQLQFLPANSPIVPLDGSSAASPVTFGPRGLPCKPLAGVCDSLGGPQAYWIFFQDNVTQNWGAVTVTPAGRIQRWIYSGGGAGAWFKY